MLPLHPNSTSNKSRANLATEGDEFLSPMNSVNQFNFNQSSNNDSDNDEFVSAKGSFTAPKLRSLRGSKISSKMSSISSHNRLKS